MPLTRSLACPVCRGTYRPETIGRLAADVTAWQVGVPFVGSDGRVTFNPVNDPFPHKVHLAEGIADQLRGMGVSSFARLENGVGGPPMLMGVEVCEGMGVKL